MIAYAWASGLIEFSDESQPPAGAILVARGPKSYLRTVVGVKARNSIDRQLLVPGIPEASDQQEAIQALDKWLAWCGQSNGKKGAYGVEFSPPGLPTEN